MIERAKLVRISTVPITIDFLLKDQLKILSTDFEVWVISSGGPELENIKNREGVNVIPLNMTRAITPLKDLIALIRLTFLLFKLKPRIVHSITPKAGLLAMLAGFFARVPIRIHDLVGMPLMEETGIKKWILIKIEKITYLFSSIVIPNSFGLRDFIIKNQICEKEKIRMILNGSTNGVDLDYFNPKYYENSKQIIRKKLGLNNNDFIYLFIGRLVKDKGINELVSAFKIINNKFNNTKLILVGEQESHLDPLNTKTINELKNNPNIILIGIQKDVRPYFSISNCFVFPSYREGLPNVLLEAAAMNLPIICTDIIGNNEVVKSGINGILCQPKNQFELLVNMREYYLNEINYANKPRELMIGKYDKSIFIQSLIFFYRGLFLK